MHLYKTETSFSDGDDLDFGEIVSISIDVDIMQGCLVTYINRDGDEKKVVYSENANGAFGISGCLDHISNILGNNKSR